MQRNIGFYYCTVIALVLGVVYSGLAGEKKITKKQVPAVVISAFEASYPKASVKGYAKEVENGKTYYEIESVDGKTNRDILYLADGTVAEVEETAAAGELPEAVKATVSKEYPKGIISKAEKTTKGSVVKYEIHLTSGKAKHELVVDPIGKVMKQMKEAKEDEDVEKSEMKK